MINRNAFIITVLAVVVVTGYNIRQLQEPVSLTTRPAGALPVVESAPTIEFRTPQRSAIASLDVWNLKPATMPGQLPALKDLFKPFYTLNNNGRFAAIQRSDRPNEQWEFHGVLARGNTLRALFYNPGLRKLKNLGLGDVVDERLVIRGIGTGRVTLAVVGEKTPLIYELHIFKTNKELYAAKRKKP